MYRKHRRVEYSPARSSTPYTRLSFRSSAHQDAFVSQVWNRLVRELSTTFIREESENSTTSELQKEEKETHSFG
jgi:hypothetical protein